MNLHILPERTADAAGNMATDFLLLRRYPDTEVARFRHYRWQRPSFTFGYGQKIAFVRERLPAASEEGRLDLTRRPTGGGIVDHRNDWTYALVLPCAHPLWDRPGPAIYDAVHAALAETLNDLGANVRLQREEPESAAGVCFERPEIGDVVRVDDGRKVAGAALKRTKQGVLLQGSIWRPHVSEIEWDALAEKFTARLACELDLEPGSSGWPGFDSDEEQALVDQYASSEWLEAR